VEGGRTSAGPAVRPSDVRWPTARRTASANITEDKLEAFHIARRGNGRASSTLNNEVQVIKAAFRWAAKKGYTPRSPISDGSMLRRKLDAAAQKGGPASASLAPDEESQLLEAAGRGHALVR